MLGPSAQALAAEEPICEPRPAVKPRKPLRLTLGNRSALATPMRSATAMASSAVTGPIAANCSIPSEFKLYYRTNVANCSTAGGAMPDPVWNVGATATTIPAQPVQAANACFKPYDPASPRPADMARRNRCCCINRAHQAAGASPAATSCPSAPSVPGS